MKAPEMQLGFFTAILNELSFAEVVDFAAKKGFACLEAACWPAGKAERIQHQFHKLRVIRGLHRERITRLVNKPGTRE